VSEVPVTIEHSVIIEADPETVFGVLIDPRLMAEWFGISHVLEAKAGGMFRVEVSEGNIAVGVYTEVTPHRRVAFTWGWESTSPAVSALSALKPGSSHVEIDLEPHSRGTLLRLVHRELPDDLARLHRERWEHHLNRLATRMAKGGTRNEDQNDQADRDIQGAASESV
jgi:uncharacterized protein YndB with AHSA1/START domain